MSEPLANWSTEIPPCGTCKVVFRDERARENHVCEGDPVAQSIVTKLYGSDEPSRFTLTIELGNERMQTPVDVAGALGVVQSQLGALSKLTPDESRAIFDINGNTIGGWSVQ